MKRRSYDNSFRAEQAEQTKRRILAAVGELLADESPSAISTAAVASKAGVSEPTVYRYFANRDALFEAAAEQFSREAGAPPLATNASELPWLMVAVARYFGRSAKLMRASLRNPLGAEVRAAGRKRREQHNRALLAPKVARLREADREVAIAAFLTVMRMESWDYLTSKLGLDDEQAGRANGWIVEAMLESLERKQREGKHDLLEEPRPDWQAIAAATRDAPKKIPIRSGSRRRKK